MTLSGTVTDLREREHDPHASDSSLRYMPGLDVVRGLAILMVLCYHGLFDVTKVTSAAQGGLFRILHWGSALGLYGVHIFFLLSGFLITGILLSSRNKPGYYRIFYLRRAARILPAGLLMVIVLKAGGWISWPYFGAAVLYLANMPGVFGAAPEYGPLWSLAVEEQFYLVWPLVVRNCSRRVLVWICTTIILLTPVLRFALLGKSVDWNSVQHKTWAVCDFFVAGALIALAVRNPAYAPLLRRLFPWLLGIGGALVVLSNSISLRQPNLSSRLFFSFLLEPWLLFGSGLILFAFFCPSIANLLWARVFIFLAKISYGLYLCHLLIFRLIEEHWKVASDGSLHSLSLLLSRFILEALVAIAIAFISRWTYEEFFLRLKPKSKPRIA